MKFRVFIKLIKLIITVIFTKPMYYFFTECSLTCLFKLVRIH